MLAIQANNNIAFLSFSGHFDCVVLIHCSKISLVYQSKNFWFPNRVSSALKSLSAKRNTADEHMAPAADTAAMYLYFTA